MKLFFLILFILYLKFYNIEILFPIVFIVVEILKYWNYIFYCLYYSWIFEILKLYFLLSILQLKYWDIEIVYCLYCSACPWVCHLLDSIQLDVHLVRMNNHHNLSQDHHNLHSSIISSCHVFLTVCDWQWNDKRNIIEWRKKGE